MRKMLKSLVVLLVLPAVATAATISVDISAGDALADGDGQGLQSGAGAVGAAGDIWNDAVVVGGWAAAHDVISLVDTTGAATGASLTVYNTQFRGVIGGSPWGGPIGALISDGIHWWADNDISISGLTGASYDVYVYGGPWDGNGTVVTIGGESVPILTANSWAEGEINEGEEYAKFTVAPVAGQIDVTLGLYAGNAWLSGIQLVEVVPEPASMLLLGMGALFLRKKK